MRDGGMRSQRVEGGLTITLGSTDKNGGQMLSPSLQWLGGLSFDPKHREVNTTQSHVSAYKCVCVSVCVATLTVFWTEDFLKKKKKKKRARLEKEREAFD